MLLVLTFGAAVTVSAAEVETIEHVWVDENGTALSDGAYPDIELTFTPYQSEAREATNEAYGVSEGLPNISIRKPVGSGKIYVDGIENIKGAGYFTYYFKADDPNVAGVTVSTDNYAIEILRTFVMVNGKATTDVETKSIAFYVENEGKLVKIDTISSTFVTSDLSIDKKVTGNLAYKDDEFTVELTFSSDAEVVTDIILPDSSAVEFSGEQTYTGTATLTISDNAGIMTIKDIPAGVEVTVNELDPDPYELVGYSVNDGDSVKDAPTITASAQDASVVITNDYSTEIDMGVTLDSLPYILILLTVGCAAVFYFMRMRKNALEAE